ncbi:MAG: NAD-binding protein, partial [Phycisphaerae bacterium]|nr:NAD-binding protein [Phycisphaerae bacterium]
EGGRRKVVVMGGPAMAVWLSRALHDKSVAIRLFETNRARAEELADKLEWVTVVNADPTDPAVFEEERIGEADSFVALRTDDEHNILSCAWAKSAGVKQTIAVITRPTYSRLIERVGVDEAVNPSAVAARQIALELDTAGLVPVASLGEGAIQIFRVRVGPRSELLGKPLRKLKLSPKWMVAAIQHGQQIRVPTAEDFIHVDDNVIVVGKPGDESRLGELFDV